MGHLETVAPQRYAGCHALEQPYPNSARTKVIVRATELALWVSEPENQSQPKRKNVDKQVLKWSIENPPSQKRSKLQLRTTRKPKRISMTSRNGLRTVLGRSRPAGAGIRVLADFVHADGTALPVVMCCPVSCRSTSPDWRSTCGPTLSVLRGPTVGKTNDGGWSGTAWGIPPKTTLPPGAVMLVLTGASDRSWCRCGPTVSSGGAL